MTCPPRDFYPRSPCGERQVYARKEVFIHGKFLSTLSLRRATSKPITSYFRLWISIHALLAESDDILSILIIGFLEFLSTLSLRRATASTRIDTDNNSDFYPRSPCGERPRKGQSSGAGIGISIHALLAESDISALWTVANHQLFLSTLSLRRATCYSFRHSA